MQISPQSNPQVQPNQADTRQEISRRETSPHQVELESAPTPPIGVDPSQRVGSIIDTAV